MAIPILTPRGILAQCDPATKTITIFEEQEALRLSDSELRRLTDLGEQCIKIAQTFGGQSVREEMQELGLETMGSREYPNYLADVEWIFGITGGLEIYGAQQCDGSRGALVADHDEDVLMYRCDGVIAEPENPRILTYVKGLWEERIPELYKIARRIRDRKILTLEDINF